MKILGRGNGFPPTWLDIWVKPGAEIKISGANKLIRTWNVKSNVQEQLEENEYKAKTKDNIVRSQEIMRDAYALFDERNVFSERRNEIKQKMDLLYKLDDSLNMLIFQVEFELMKKAETHSHVWMIKLHQHSRYVRYTNNYPYKETVVELYKKMSNEEKNSELGQIIGLNLNPPTVVEEGEDMADGDLFDLNGQLQYLVNYKGKYLLLDFWPAGCGPCMMAVPEMREISESYKDKLTVISISSDPKDIWKKVSKEKEINWVNLNDFKGTNGIFMRYGANGIPHYAFISPEGKLAATWTGYGKGSLKAKMEELIK